MPNPSKRLIMRIMKEGCAMFQIPKTPCVSTLPGYSGASAKMSIRGTLPGGERKNVNLGHTTKGLWREREPAYHVLCYGGGGHNRVPWHPNASITLMPEYCTLVVRQHYVLTLPKVVCSHHQRKCAHSTKTTLPSGVLLV